MEFPRPFISWLFVLSSVFLPILVGCAGLRARDPFVAPVAEVETIVIEPEEEPDLSTLQEEIDHINQQIAHFENDKSALLEVVRSERDNTKEYIDTLGEDVLVEEKKLHQKLEAVENAEKKLELTRKGLEVAVDLGVRESVGSLTERLENLLRDVQHQEEELEILRKEIEAKEAWLADWEGKDEQGQILATMDRLYKKAVDLYIQYADLWTELIGKSLIAGHDKAAFVRIQQERLEKLETAKKGVITKELFDDFRIEMRLDEAMNRALVFGHVFLVKFDLGDDAIELEPDSEKDFASLAEAMRSLKYAPFEFRVFIDGHSDTAKFRGSLCVSAQKNKALAMRRAVALKNYTEKHCGIEESRISVDWYGNFNLAVEPKPNGERENRRVELRVTTLENDAYTSHGGYFSMRDGLPFLGGHFQHNEGRWIDKRCKGVEHVRQLKYMGSEYIDLALRLGLDEALEMPLAGEEQGNLKVRLGNQFTLFVDGQCVEVEGCGDETNVEWTLEEGSAKQKIIPSGRGKEGNSPW